jgi:PhnB protein
MAGSTKAAPEGKPEVIPYLAVDRPAEAVAFYVKVFGARELVRMCWPGTDQILHAELAFGDSRVFLGAEAPEMGVNSPLRLGGSPVTIQIYVPDADATVAGAAAAGATVTTPVATMFWGDRLGKFTDPFGHVWSVATHVEDVPPALMEERLKAMMAGGAPG